MACACRAMLHTRALVLCERALGLHKARLQAVTELATTRHVAAASSAQRIRLHKETRRPTILHRSCCYRSAAYV
eukprot:7174225-Pyramimonas_sp.AAC.1